MEKNEILEVRISPGPCFSTSHTGKIRLFLAKNYEKSVRLPWARFRGDYKQNFHSNKKYFVVDPS